jgi:chromate reductase
VNNAKDIPVTNTKDIAVLVGSLRQGSLNRKAALALRSLAPAGTTLDLVEIGHLPFYNEDLERDPARRSEAYDAFRARIARADGVLFATPEYNRSISAVLKNALDIGSRPYGKSVWSGKPAAVMSTSISPLGGLAANQQLRLLLANLDMLTMQQPEVHLSAADKLFDGDGKIAADATRDFLSSFIARFDAWIERHRLTARAA